MGLYRGLAVGSRILAVVLGSLVQLAGTEWPAYPAGLWWRDLCLRFHGLRRRADRAKRRGGCAEAG